MPDQLFIPSSAVIPLTEKLILEKLDKVMDPELGVSIVKLGLIYKVEIREQRRESGEFKKENQLQLKVKILMTLTTPGCPLAHVFDSMVRDALYGTPGLDVDQEVAIELTFDPPWIPDMMDAETKAELGFD
jgi:metal-sulfur cluster biosynthetic enzyme